MYREKVVKTKEKKKLFMAITADEYELPMGVFDSVNQMSNAFNISYSMIRAYMSRGNVSKKNGCRFISIEL